MNKVKVGDKVRHTYNNSQLGEFKGMIGEIIQIPDEATRRLGYVFNPNMMDKFGFSNNPPHTWEKI